MTVLHTHDGSTVTPSGWFNLTGQASIVSDPEKGNVLQLATTGMTYPGSGTARIDTYPEIGAFGATRLYVAFWEKLSPTFKGNNGSGSLKNVIVKTASNYSGLPNGAIHLPALLNDPTNVDGRIRIFDSFINTTDFDGRHHDPANNDQALSPDAGDILSRGVWHFIENVVDFNSRGLIDGSVKTWVDGVLVASATGIKNLYDGTARVTGIELSNVWGGGGTSISVDNYYRFKDIYVSGGFARNGERPDHWKITLLEGSNPAAGSDLHVVAQLVDSNGNPVDIFAGYLPVSINITGGATWDASATASPYTELEHGQLYYTVHTSKVPGTVHVITVDDYGTVNNGNKGDHRVGTATITVR